MAGDIVIDLQNNVIGILHSTQAQSASCNGRLALRTPSDPYVTIGACLHIDDISKATIPDSSKPSE